MKKDFIILVLILFAFTLQVVSQSFNVKSIFNSGATFGVEYLAPSSIDDSTDFQMTKYKMEFVKVLRTRECDIQDFDQECNDSKANQLFLASKFSLSDPNLSNNDFFKKQFKAEVELIYITASKTKGVWFHGVNLNAEENNETFPANLSPNFRAYSIYIHAKNLKFIPFIGPSFAVAQGNIFLLPIFGFRAKLSRNLAAELIAPIHFKLKYNYKSKIDFELASAYNSIHTVYRDDTYLNKNDGLNLQQLKIHIGVNTRLYKYYKFKVELGYAFLQELDPISYDNSQKMNSMPFINFSFNYNFGNSILHKFFNEEKPKKI
ncbi:MAG: hypothetical protein P1U41_09570, partial [Vicingaceae bacterium]|nr:hypothetical protein [Vicingaceae bacterium]